MRPSPRLGVLSGAAILVTVAAAAVAVLLLTGEIERDFLIALGAALLVGAVLAAGAETFVSRPLSALAQTARRIRTGDLDTPAPSAGPSEVRALAAVMEEMRIAIRDAHDDLERVNRGLSQRVETATGDLASTARELSVLHAAASQLTGVDRGGLDEVTEELTRLDWVDGAFMALVNEQGRLVPVARSNLGPGAVDRVLSAVQEIFPPDAITRGIFVENVGARTATRTLVGQGVTALAVVPVDTPEGVAGIIGCVRHNPIALSEGQQMLLRSIADQVAVTLVRSELVDEAAESRRLAESVLRDMSDGVIVLDAEERCRVCNPAAARMLAVERSSILGQPTTTWFPLPASVLQTLRARVERPDDAVGPVLSELEGRQLALTAGPFVDPDPANRGMILLIRDLTGEAEAERIKRDFVSMVGHELRTPLTTIRTSIDLLHEAEAGTLNATQQRIVEVLEGNSDRLLHLIDDLLDMSALDSGRVEVHQATIDLVEAVRETVEGERAKAETKSIALQVDHPAGGVPVWADRARLGQVLANLISNAVKYTPEGGHVTVRVVPSDPFAQVDVVDDGIGIPVAEQPQLFEKFFRTREGQRQSGGTGLGLAIARSIVELHGGEIWCESDGRSGSTFSFTLPRHGPAVEAR